MTDLDKRINECFPGLVVRKDLVKTVKGNAVVPSYVLEYLLGQYCATNDEATIVAGIENVKEIIRLHYVNRNEAELVKSRIKEKGHWKVIDKIGVDLNERKGIYEAEFSNLGIKHVPLDSETVKRNRKLLVGGVWCLVDVSYEVSEEKDVSPWQIISLKPVQLSGFDNDEFLRMRSLVSSDEWIDILIQSLGFAPDKFGRRNKFFQLMRLIPFCERNYNLIELGPKGTGKSHVYTECSPHGMLLSGGEVSVAKLFVNNSNGKIGLVGFWDCVAFDEFAGKQKKPDQKLTDIMKNYMANKTFSRGRETLGGEASFAFVGNTIHTVPIMLKNSHLFEPLPDAYLDSTNSAMLDRIYNYIPGWEIDIIRAEMYSDGYGFIVDYLSEAMHFLRELDYSNRYQKFFTLSPTISSRDRDGVHKTFSGLLKLLYPNGEATKEQTRELLEYALEGRKRVKDQLMRIDKTYTPVDFSFTDNETGEKISVRTLEEIQYPQFFNATTSMDEGATAQRTQTVIDSSTAVVASAKKEVENSNDASSFSDNSTTFEHYLDIAENQRGIDFDILFGAYLQGATEVLIVDPFIRQFHQARNLMEFMETVLRKKGEADEVTIKLLTCCDELKPENQEEYLSQIQLACQGVGIDFSWEYKPTKEMHDRYIETDTGWRIALGRGLDIYQPCDLKNAFAFTSRIPSQRNCKAFTISYMKTK